jgi:hypothetical protein
MDISGPVLAVGTIKRGGIPRTGVDPKCLIVEVKTLATRGEFVPIEIAENAASDLAAKLVEFLDGPHQSTQSLEAELEAQND